MNRGGKPTDRREYTLTKSFCLQKNEIEGKHMYIYNMCVCFVQKKNIQYVCVWLHYKKIATCRCPLCGGSRKTAGVFLAFRRSHTNAGTRRQKRRYARWSHFFFNFPDRVPAVVSAGTLHCFWFYFPPLHRRFEARQWF